MGKARDIEQASARQRAHNALYAMRETLVNYFESVKWDSLNVTAENARALVEELDELRDLVVEATHVLDDGREAELARDDEATLHERPTLAPVEVAS